MSTHVRRSALVRHSPQEMFDLVNDVGSYPEFLPHCRSAQVLEAREAEVKARIELAKGALHKSFTTLNHLDPPHRIEMQLVDGPFRRLHGVWLFSEVAPGRTSVVLDLEFEFASRLIGLALGPVFHPLVNSLVDAFVARARSIHGDGDD